MARESLVANRVYFRKFDARAMMMDPMIPMVTKYIATRASELSVVGSDIRSILVWIEGQLRAQPATDYTGKAAGCK